MRHEPQDMDSLLLDLHLDRLDADERLHLEQILAESPERAAKSEALRCSLSVLDAYEVAEPPTDLCDLVMSRIDEQTQTLPFDAAASALPGRSAREFSGAPMLTLRELIAIAACITLFVGVFVPGYRKAQNIARRNLCRENQRQIGMAMASYAEGNDGFLPWTEHVPNGSWLPKPALNVPRYSNTAPLYVLLRDGHVQDRNPRVFLCPSVPNARPMLTEDYAQFKDFPESANVTYASLLWNLPHGRRLGDMHPRMALVGDRNPRLGGDRGAHKISPYDEAMNSLVHEQGAGQNVIFANGSGGWFTRPDVGVDNDDIYRLGQLTEYDGTETPTSKNDTMLVP